MHAFERFFSISSELFLVTTGSGRIERVNPRWRETLGFEPEELHGKQICEFFHPDDREYALGLPAEIAKQGERTGLVNRCVHKDGRTVWIKWSVSFDPATGLLYSTGVDITPEREALQNLELLTAQATDESSSLIRERERSTILRQLIEASKDGFGYCDPNFRPVYLNHFLVEDLGWKADAHTIFDFLSPATRLRYESEIIPEVIGRRGSWEGEVEFLNTKTGESVPIWQKTFCIFTAKGDPQYVAFFATDLRTKRRAEAAIFHSSKMASLGQMAAGIAHEVNNPITIIHGTAGLLKKALLSDEKDSRRITNGLERIEKTALRISRIIKGLRMFSRSGENDPAMPTPLAEILEETLDLCRERFRDFAIDLRIEEVPEIAVRCRPTQISQVLLNLLNNSFDAVSREPEKWVRIAFAHSPE